MLAKSLAEKLEVPFITALKRVGTAKKQRTLTPEERALNVKGKFEINCDVSGKRLILIDDVVTTGSTVGECAKILKENGAKAVYVLAIAK